MVDWNRPRWPRMQDGARHSGMYSSLSRRFVLVKLPLITNIINRQDPRPDVTGYVQGSTCGYFGHYYVQNVYDILENEGGELPDILPGDYYVSNEDETCSLRAEVCVLLI